MNTDKTALTAANQGELAETPKNDGRRQTQSAALVRTMNDIMQLATMLSGNPQNKQAVALTVQQILFGLDMGIGIGAAVTGIYIVDGKPTVGAGVMSAAIKGSEKYDFSIIECTRTKCILRFFEARNEVGIVETKLDDFPHLKNKNNWKNYPDDMLFARAISKGMRRYCPDVFGMTVYVEGEIENSGLREPFNITHAAVVEFDAAETEKELLLACENRNENEIKLILDRVKTEHPAEHNKLRRFAKIKWKATEPAEPEQSKPTEQQIIDAVNNGKFDLINE